MVANCPRCGREVAMTAQDMARLTNCPYCQHVLIPGFNPRRERRRSVNLLILAILLLVSYFVPVPLLSSETAWDLKVAFPNIEILSANAPWSITMLLQSPLIVGVVLALAALLASYPWRGIILCLLPLVPGVALAAAMRSEALFGPGRISVSPFLSMATSAGMLGAVSLVLLIAGVRLRFYRPLSLSGYVLGCVGAGLVLLQWLLPTYGYGAAYELMQTSYYGPDPGMLRHSRDPSDILPGSSLTMTLAMLWEPRLVWFALGSLLSMLCMAAAAVLCFVNHPGGRPRAMDLRARAATWLVALAPVVSLTTMLVATACHAPPESQAGATLALMLPLIFKILLTMLALFLLLPAGLTDLVLGRPPARPAAA